MNGRFQVTWLRTARPVTTLALVMHASSIRQYAVERASRELFSV